MRKRAYRCGFLRVSKHLPLDFCFVAEFCMCRCSGIRSFWDFVRRSDFCDHSRLVVGNIGFGCDFNYATFPFPQILSADFGRN